MKNLFAFLVLVLLSSILHSQIDETFPFVIKDSLRYIIDEDYRLDSILNYESFVENSWEENSKTIYGEHSNGDTVIHERYKYKWENEIWIPESGFWHYYLDNNWIRIDDYIWDSQSNEWHLESYSLRTYNLNDRIDKRTFFKFDTITNSWEITQSTTYEYDSNENLIQSVTLYLIEGELLPVYKEIMHVDSNNNIIYRKIYFDNGPIYALNPWRTDIMGYDSLNRWVTTHTYIHSPPTSDSSLHYIDSTFWYNENESERISYSLQDSIIGPSRREQGYISDTLRYYYDDIYVEDAWKNIQYYEVHLNLPGFISYIYEYQINITTNDSITREVTYWYKENYYVPDSVLTSWFVKPEYSLYPDQSIEYYYYTDVTNIWDFDEPFNKISVFPNPGKQMSTIAFPFDNKTLIRVFDISGKVIAEQTVYNQNQYQLNLSNFPIGTLIVQVSNNETNAVVKLIKQ